MPTYVYKFVKTGETIEVEQAFTDPPLTKAKHPQTNRSMLVKKVFTPVGVTFRGDGFYKTDSRTSKGEANGKSTGESTSNEGSSGETSAKDVSKKDTKDTSAKEPSAKTSSTDKASTASTG